MGKSLFWLDPSGSAIQQGAAERSVSPVAASPHEADTAIRQSGRAGQGGFPGRHRPPPPRSNTKTSLRPEPAQSSLRLLLLGAAACLPQDTLEPCPSWCSAGSPAAARALSRRSSWKHSLRMAGTPRSSTSRRCAWTEMAATKVRRLSACCLSQAGCRACHLSLPSASLPIRFAKREGGARCPEVHGGANGFEDQVCHL